MLLPATPGFALSGFEPVTPRAHRSEGAPAPTGEVRHGTRGGPPDVRLLGGYFVFDSPDAALLVSLLPALVHVRGTERLSILVRLVGEESSNEAGRELVLARLVEVLLIEALRSTPGRTRPRDWCADWPMRASRSAMRQMHATAGAPVDRGPTREDGRAVALGVLRAVHARRGPAAHGVPARLAHGGGKDLLRRRELGLPRSRARRLRFGEHLQHRVQPARRACAESLRAREFAARHDFPRVSGHQRVRAGMATAGCWGTRSSPTSFQPPPSRREDVAHRLLP